MLSAKQMSPIAMRDGCATPRTDQIMKRDSGIPSQWPKINVFASKFQSQKGAEMTTAQMSHIRPKKIFSSLQ